MESSEYCAHANYLGRLIRQLHCISQILHLSYGNTKVSNARAHTSLLWPWQHLPPTTLRNVPRLRPNNVENSNVTS